MITPDKIEEWLREVKERPSSAPVILQYIANRLSDLARWNEELRAENLELRTGRKVEEYEKRIAKLAYQVELLTRQVGSGGASAEVETLSLLIYNPKGETLRVAFDPAGLESRKPAARFLSAAAVAGERVKLLVTGSHEELLFVFDSGRTVAMPVEDVPAADAQALDWREAFLQEPRGAEELAAIAPIGRMALSEACIQTSLRGCVKRMLIQYFEAHIANNFIGSGVKQTQDKTCDLTLCGKEELFGLASREGFLLALEPAGLSYSAEEALKLAGADYVVNTFVTGGKSSLLVMTQTGKAIHRDIGWLEPASSLKTRGRPVYSQSRREAGVRVAGAAAVNEDDWGVTLDLEGRLTFYRMSDLFASGAVGPEESQAEILWFSAFSSPGRDGEGE